MNDPVGSNRAEDSLATRGTLLARLKNWDDADSWQDFSRTYERLILGVARKSGLSEAECQDVLQEVLLSVAKTIEGFESNAKRGSFKSWLLNLTRWRITDQLRKRNGLPPLSGKSDRSPEETATIERVPDPAGSLVDRAWEHEWQLSVMEAAIERLRRRVKPRHFQVFDLYNLRQWTPQKVARELGITRMQVYLVHHRLARLLKEEVTRVEQRLA
jgi:RNA polymerase sigma factor (sigma-70 family)